MTVTKTFIDQDFLLTHDLARYLYHEVAYGLPIIDFHNHLPPDQIAQDTRPENLATLWVTADQYKHRAMRINGIAESGITGDAPAFEKYMNWVRTLPNTLGNPLYPWSYLELKRVFDVDTVLDEQNARAVWEQCNERIQSGAVSPVALLKQWRVEALCTSDDLLDDVSVHSEASRHGVSVRPSLRTDTMVDTSEAFRTWCDRLAVLTDVSITDLTGYEAAIEQRLDRFSEAGCVLADQALDAGFGFTVTDKATADRVFKRLIAGESLSEPDEIVLKSYLLFFIGKSCAERHWAWQLHIGAQRSTSTRLKNRVGGAGGYATIGSATDITTLVSLLDTLDLAGQLPRLILYNLNPVDNAALATLTGSFSEDGVAAKIQFGPAWWYNDHYAGITRQLTDLASHSLLPHSIGMTTDSRSFLSMSRHEYFRRIFCQWVADGVTKGLLPGDTGILQKLVESVCYENAKKWILNPNDKK